MRPCARRDHDTQHFLKIVEKVLPIGGKGWKVVGEKYNKWAQENERAERDQKSLETKYKQARRHFNFP
jgi:hypothetical protein